MTDSIVNTTKAYPAIHIQTDTDGANAQDWLESLNPELRDWELLSDEALANFERMLDEVAK